MALGAPGDGERRWLARTPATNGIRPRRAPRQTRRSETAASDADVKVGRRGTTVVADDESAPEAAAPTVSCSRCGRQWDLTHELDELRAGNRAVEQFAIDHERPTGRMCSHEGFGFARIEAGLNLRIVLLELLRCGFSNPYPS